MKKLITAVFASTLLISAASFAEEIPGHPRVSEVDSRIENQQQRIDKGVADGTINAKQAARDDTKLTHEETALSKDEAKHNGHITKREQRQLNKGLNKNSKRIHKQRAE